MASRVVKGLYWHEFKERLLDNYKTTAWEESGLAEMAQDSRDKLTVMCSKLVSEPPKTIGDNVFSYWFQQVAEDKYTSAWILRFYESVYFFCVTAPKDNCELPS